MNVWLKLIAAFVLQSRCISVECPGICGWGLVGVWSCLFLNYSSVLFASLCEICVRSATSLELEVHICRFPSSVPGGLVLKG